MNIGPATEIACRLRITPLPIVVLSEAWPVPGRRSGPTDGKSPPKLHTAATGTTHDRGLLALEVRNWKEQVMAIHQCPRCELRFISSSEVEWHLLEDHGSQALATRAAVPTPGSTRSPPRRAVDPDADSIGFTEKESRRSRTPCGCVVLLGAVGVSIVGLWRAARRSARSPLRLCVGRIVVGGSWWFSDRLVIRACGARPLEGQCRSRRWSPSSPVGRRFLPRGATSHRFPSPTRSLIGRTPRHAAIVVTEGLLSLLEPTRDPGRACPGTHPYPPS